MARSVCAIVVVAVLWSSGALAQEPSATPQQAVVGTIVSLRSSTLILKTDDNHYIVFALDRGTLRPKTLALGAHVTVESATAGTSQGDIRTATSVILTGPQPSAAVPGSDEAIPPSVRRLERQIAGSIRRYRAGIRGGIALDPELVSIGAHATFGPIFSRRLLARPNVEFAYGELTTSFAINLEGVYRLTSTMPRNQWSPYAGGGLTLGFSHEGFSTPEGTERSFDFGNFDFNAGLNLLFGVERPGGAFIEMKATIYTDPRFRLLFGHTF